MHACNGKQRLNNSVYIISLYISAHSSKCMSVHDLDRAFQCRLCSNVEVLTKSVRKRKPLRRPECRQSLWFVWLELISPMGQKALSVTDTRPQLTGQSLSLTLIVMDCAEVFLLVNMSCSALHAVSKDCED